MLIGDPPFYPAKSKPELFDKIKMSEPRIPSHYTKKVKSLIEGLLKKKPQERLGTRGAE